MSQIRNSYTVDTVLCIDGTGSMAGMMNKVKDQAKNFPDLYRAAMLKSKRNPGKFRVKVIVFRDYAEDGAYAMEESPDFFDLSNPEEQEAFEAYVNSIEPVGGGDDDENALEAIALALRSHWTDTGDRYRRQAILLFTDADAHPLWDPVCFTAPNYPMDVPEDLKELRKLYLEGDLEFAPYYTPSRGRLIIFAPNVTTSVWAQIQAWERTWVVPTNQNGGCEEVELEDALAVLVNSF